MTYLGNTPVTQSFISGTDYFNGTGSQTVFTLTRSVASINDIQVTVNNVVQQPNSGYTVSNTTLTFDQAPSAGTNNVYVRYLSTTTQAITPSQNTVSWNTLDSNVQGDLGISFKNRIINSNMAIDQRNAGAAVTVNTAAAFYPVDRFRFSATASAGVFTAQQVTDAPAGFTNSARVTVTTTDSSLAATDLYYCAQTIEGFNSADLGFGTVNASTITISFWVKSSVTGTFGGVIANGSSWDRSYPFSYTINAANNWEYETITIPGDITGTWVRDNNIGMRIVFGLGVGSTFSGTAGAWSASQLLSSTGATNLMATNGATWQLTGVQLERGTQATTFTTAGGSYGAELALCQRYFEKTYSQSAALGTNTSEGVAQSMSPVSLGGVTYGTTFQYKVTKRATPTITGYLVGGTSGQWFTGVIGSSEAAGTFTAQNIGDTGFRPTATSSGSPNSIYGHLAISAEL
jgi:hypothetical protein